MGDTSISWTDKTWNCIRGCSRVSAGCVNCYAERQALRFAGPGGTYEGLVTKRLKVINADERDKGNYIQPQWTGKVDFVHEHLADPLRWKKPCRVFVNSMSDIFHEALTNEQIAAMFGVMAAAPHHTFQVLTKRAERMREWFGWLRQEAVQCNHGRGMTQAARCLVDAQFHDSSFFRGEMKTGSRLRHGDVVARAMAAPWPLPNVWLGVSVENQDAAEGRIPELLTTPAAVRFISAEPLLGELDLWAFLDRDVRNKCLAVDNVKLPGLDWVIAGAESGPRARPCDYRWLRSLRDQCKSAGTAFFLKQARCGSENGPGIDSGGIRRAANIVVSGGPGAKKKGNGIFERPYLDGRQHLEFPA